MKQISNGGKGPAKTFGKSVRVTVWRNEGEKGGFLTLKPERRYKDKDGSWKSSASFSIQQALRLHFLLGMALAECLSQDDESEGTAEEA